MEEPIGCFVSEWKTEFPYLVKKKGSVKGNFLIG
jgi:hypothetical protein